VVIVDRRTRGIAVAAAVCSILMFAPVPAQAEPPPNDTEATAISFTSLPFTHTEDTTEATTNGPQYCEKSGSVFYRFRTDADVWVQIDTVGSDYDTVLGVYRRTRSGIDQIKCNDDRLYPASAVRFVAHAGRWYTIMVGKDRRTAGELTITATEVNDVTLEMTSAVTGGTYDTDTGTATIEGTVSCNERSVFYVEAEVRQLRHNGLFVAQGYGYTEGTCTPESDTVWTLDVESYSGIAFGSGSAHVESYLYGDDGFGDRVRPDEGVDDTITLVAG
jgi:hypothetical protein